MFKAMISNLDPFAVFIRDMDDMTAIAECASRSVIKVILHRRNKLKQMRFCEQIYEIGAKSLLPFSVVVSVVGDRDIIWSYKNFAMAIASTVDATSNDVIRVWSIVCVVKVARIDSRGSLSSEAMAKVAHDNTAGTTQIFFHV